MKKTATTLLLLILAGNIQGLNLEPLSMNFEPEGRNSIRTFRVANNQEQPIAVRIYMTTRELQQDGSETRNPADADFTVFPQSLFLMPGQSQALRVQWKGKTVVERELSYRIVAEQLPVKDSSTEGESPENGVTLNFLYRFVGAVYITPDNAAENIVLKGVFPSESAEQGRDKGTVELHFENIGTSHAIIRTANIVLRSTGGAGNVQTLTLGPDDLEVLHGANFLASATLIQKVVLPEEMQGSDIEVDFSFETSK